MSLSLLLILFLVASAGGQYVIMNGAQKYNLFLDPVNTERPQSIHSTETPRSGGIGIFVLTALIIPIHPRLFLPLFVLLIPVFLVGLIEDFGPHVDPWIRLATVGTAAAGFIFLMDAKLSGIGLLNFPPSIAIPFTIFAITGVTNAMNVVDGLHGLSSGLGIIASSSLGLVASLHGDATFMGIFLLFSVILLGFFLLNFPYGNVFLGDSGSYTVGFLLAMLSILLVNRNPEISPWFPVLALAYPIVETLYSIFRRAVYRNTSPFEADQAHLYSILFLKRNCTNPKASLLILSFMVLTVLAALKFHTSTNYLGCLFFLFWLFYLVVYHQLNPIGSKSRTTCEKGETQ